MELRSGSQIIVNGTPIQLLYLLVRLNSTTDIWVVKPLFTDEPNRQEELSTNGIYKELHSKIPGWNYSLGARPRSIYGG